MGGLVSYQERVERILKASHIVLPEDSSIYRVDSVERLGPIIFVNCGNRILFQDTEVFTLDEYAEIVQIIINLKEKLNIK
jgi:hypothetical protein